MSRTAALALALGLAACASPAPKQYALVDLRVCVQDASFVEAYTRHFAAAVASEPSGGRECDVTAQVAALNTGQVTMRSAYDGTVLAEIEGPMDLAPQLAALSLSRVTQAYRRVSLQRAAYSFPH